MFYYSLLLLAIGFSCVENSVVSYSFRHGPFMDHPLKHKRDILVGQDKKLYDVNDPEEKNRTLQEAEKELGVTFPPGEQNLTIKEDFHRYYNTVFYSDLNHLLEYYVNLELVPKHMIITHEPLSSSYRKAMTIQLNFSFPFYGEPIRNVTIATGGFLYVGDYVHNWIATTQYIAPLMANFNPSLSNESAISYYDNGTAFTVEWRNILNEDHVEAGHFTFQATLFQNGNIVFVYNKIPLAIRNISSESHPVKVGISDAYILESQEFLFRKKIVFEYDRLNFTDYDIGSKSALLFKALPTCNDFKDCNSCQNSEIGFACFWCPSMARCSSTIDRHRQEWLMQDCMSQFSICASSQEIVPVTFSSSSVSTTVSSTTTISTTPSTTSTLSTTISPTTTSTTTSTTTPSTTTTSSTTMSTTSSTESTTTTSTASSVIPITSSTASEPSSSISTAELSHNSISDTGHQAHVQVQNESFNNGSMGAGGIIAIILFALLVMSLVGWIGYAYKFPHTSSGQLLIKFRPSQWHFNKSSDRHPTLQM